MGSEAATEEFEKLQEAQALYEKYLELASVGERAVLDRLAAAAIERTRVEFTTHHTLAVTLRSPTQPQ